MSEALPFDPAGMSALVVDPSHFQRRITLDQLRLIGFQTATGAADPVSAWDMLHKTRHDIVLVEWFDPECLALDFVRRIRHGEDSPNRNASLFMLTTSSALERVEAARGAGVDGYLKKPISAQAMQTRVKVGLSRPKISVAGEFDLAASEARASEALASRARVKAEALHAKAGQLETGDERAARAVLKAAHDLQRVAQDNNDDALRYGAEEMVRYLNGAAADPDVLRTHAAALLQISALPIVESEERTRLARSVKRMVDKKLRPGAAA